MIKSPWARVASTSCHVSLCKVQGQRRSHELHEVDMMGKLIQMVEGGHEEGLAPVSRLHCASQTLYQCVRLLVRLDEYSRQVSTHMDLWHSG